MKPLIYDSLILSLLGLFRNKCLRKQNEYTPGMPAAVSARVLAALVSCTLVFGSIAEGQAQTLPCNYRNLITTNFGGAVIVPARTGGTSGNGLFGGTGSVANTANVPDANLTNFATITTDPGGLLSGDGGGQISVDAGGTVVFGAGATAGYVVGSNSTLGAGLQSAITIRTYLNGAPRETSTTTNLTEFPALAGTSRRVFGFVTTQDFDEVQIFIIDNSATTTQIFYPFVQYRALSAAATATSASSLIAADGTVNLVVTGGRAPFTYAWSNGATTQNLTNVPVGTYTVTVTDANGCTTTASATVGVRVAACPVPGQNGFTAFSFDTAPVITGGPGVGLRGRYNNVATIGGQAVDIIGEVLTYSGTPVVIATIQYPRFDNFTNANSNTQLARYAIAGTATAPAGLTSTVRWTVVRNGTNTPVPFQGSFTVGDIDNDQANAAGSSLESVIVNKDDLFSYKLSSPTNTTTITTGASPTIRFQGTQNQAGTDGLDPAFTVALAYVGVSSFDITYSKVGTNPGTANFPFDGEGGIVFAANTCVPVLDTDADGVANANDLDDDNDGILDDTEGSVFADADGDGISNALDLDADNDGIPDNIEAQSTAGYIAPGTAVNIQGVLTAYAGTNGLIPVNTDGADQPDYLDTDSDNDTRLDTVEAGITLANADADGDGLDNNVDSNDAAFGPVNAGINSPGTFYPNNGTEVFWRIKQGAFTYGVCANATTTGTFVVGRPSTGVLIVPITTTRDGQVVIASVTGSGFSSVPASFTTGLAPGQTTLSIPIAYDGSGTPGTRNLTVSSPEGTGSCSTAPVTVIGLADLTTSIAQPTPTLLPNQPSNLPVTVSNIGSAPTTGPITTTLTIPANVTAPATFTSNGFGCTTTGTSVSCTNAGPIANGSSVTFSVPITPGTATANTTLSFTNVVATTSEISTTNNTGTTTVPVGGQPDLTTSISQPSPALVAGQTSTLPVGISNIGNAPTTGPITTTLTIPASVTAPATFTSNGFSCSTTGTRVACSSPGPLASAASTTFAVPITPLAAAVGTSPTFTNLVATPGESNTANNSATLTANTPVACPVGTAIPVLR